MPEPLSSDTEKIVERFVDRGLGTSGLVQRAVQQELRSRGTKLQQSVFTARAIARNLQRRRVSEFRAKQVQSMAKNRLGRPGREGGVGGIDPRLPTAQLFTFGTSGKFQLIIPGEGKGRIVDSPGQAAEIIEGLGLKGKVNFVATPGILTDDRTSIRSANKAGIQILNPKFIGGLTGRTKGLALFQGLMGMPKFKKQAPSPNAAALNTLKSDPEKFNINNVDRNTRAKLISGAYKQINSNRGLSTVGLAGRDALIGAFRSGSGASGVVQDLIRKGVVNASNFGFKTKKSS